MSAAASTLVRRGAQASFFDRLLSSRNPLLHRNFAAQVAQNPLPFRNVAETAAAFSTEAPNLSSSDTEQILKQLRSKSTKPSQIVKTMENPAVRTCMDAYTVAVKRLAKAKANAKVERILENLLCNAANEESAIRVIKLYGRASMPAHVTRTFDRLKDLGIPVSLKSFNAFLSALVRAGNPKLARDFFDKAADFGISPNTCSFNIIVNALCKMEEQSTAVKLLAEMRQKGCQPDSISYATIVDSVYDSYKRGKITRRKRKEILEKLLDDCSDPGIRYAISIRRLCKQEKALEAYDLLKEMKTEGLDFAAHTHTLYSLVIALCEQDKARAAKKVFDVISDHSRPCAQAYDTLVRSLLESDRLESAMEVCQNMMEMNRFPAAATVEKLMQELVESRNLKTQAGQLLIGRLNEHMPPHVMSKWEDRLLFA